MAPPLCCPSFFPGCPAIHLPGRKGTEINRYSSDNRLIFENFFASRRLLLFLAGTALLSETRQNITVFFNQLQYIRCSLSESVIGILFLLTSIAGLAGAASSAVTRKIGEFALSSACFLFPAFFCFLLSWKWENPFLSAVCIIGIQLAVSLFYPLQSRFQNEEIHVSTVPLP